MRPKRRHGIQHNGTQHNGLTCNTRHKWQSINDTYHNDTHDASIVNTVLSVVVMITDLVSVDLSGVALI
jgi:hypothetical protein